MNVIPSAKFQQLNCQLFSPTNQLQPWVQCYWIIQHASEQPVITSEKLYPDAGATLSIHFINKIPTIYLNFNQTVRLDTFTNSHDILSVHLKPGAIYHLLGIQPQSLESNTLTLGENFTPNWYESLLIHIEKTQGLPLQQQVSAFETWLLKLLFDRSLSRVKINSLVQAIASTLEPSGKLCQQLGISKRTLERKLQREVGVNSSTINRFYRMHNARVLLLSAENPISSIALEVGYYDHAHFCHTFKDFTQETPSEYRCRKLSQIYK